MHLTNKLYTSNLYNITCQICINNINKSKQPQSMKSFFEGVVSRTSFAERCQKGVPRKFMVKCFNWFSLLPTNSHLKYVNHTKKPPTKPATRLVIQSVAHRPTASISSETLSEMQMFCLHNRSSEWEPLGVELKNLF